MTKSIEDLMKYLLTLSKADRIEEIGKDLSSRDWKYNAISSYDLASLLGYDGTHPDGSWEFFWLFRDDPDVTLRRYFNDLPMYHLDSFEMLDFSGFDPTQIDNLRMKFKKLSDGELDIFDNNILRQEDYDLVNKIIVKQDIDEWWNYEPYAELKIISKSGYKIKFQTRVMDDGSSDILYGPYDEDEHVTEEDGIISYG